MSEKLKFALLGHGHIGKRHAAVITANTESELVAICDPDITNKDLAGNVPFYSTPEELISAGIGFDVASIATPNGLHKQHAIQMLKAGKHVLIEKPMALSTAGCAAIIETAKEVNRKVFCVMQNRYAPPVAWLQKIIQEQALGEIFFVQVNCFWNRNEAYYANSNWHGKRELDGGTLFTQFSHFIDLLYLLFGDITNIRGRFNNYRHKNRIEFEDSGTVQFGFLNGATGNLNYSTAVYKENLESSITIIGQKGTVKLGGQYMDKLVYCNILNQDLPGFPVNDPHSNHAKVLENLVDVLKGRVPAETNAEAGLKVVDMIERIYISGKES